MRYYQDFKFIASLLKPENVEFFDTKRIAVGTLVKLQKNPNRRDYILVNGGKKLAGLISVSQ